MKRSLTTISAMVFAISNSYGSNINPIDNVRSIYNTLHNDPTINLANFTISNKQIYITVFDENIRNVDQYDQGDSGYFCNKLYKHGIDNVSISYTGYVSIVGEGSSIKNDNYSKTFYSLHNTRNKSITYMHIGDVVAGGKSTCKYIFKHATTKEGFDRQTSRIREKNEIVTNKEIDAYLKSKTNNNDTLSQKPKRPWWILLLLII